MDSFHSLLLLVQHSISFVGILVISSGVIISLGKFLFHLFTNPLTHDNSYVNTIRLQLGRTLILGLEFIVAADLIGTTTTPDYYAVGILAIIVVIRTVLSFTLSREITMLMKGQE